MEDLDIKIGWGWLQAWCTFRHEALKQALRDVEAYKLSFGGRKLNEDDLADIDNRLYEEWRFRQVWASPDATINWGYPPEKPRDRMEDAFETLARTLPTLPNVPPQVDGNG